MSSKASSLSSGLPITLPDETGRTDGENRVAAGRDARLGLGGHGASWLRRGREAAQSGAPV